MRKVVFPKYFTFIRSLNKNTVVKILYSSPGEMLYYFPEIRESGLRKECEVDKPTVW